MNTFRTFRKKNRVPKPNPLPDPIYHGKYKHVKMPKWEPPINYSTWEDRPEDYEGRTENPLWNETAIPYPQPTPIPNPEDMGTLWYEKYIDSIRNSYYRKFRWEDREELPRNYSTWEDRPKDYEGRTYNPFWNESAIYSLFISGME